MHTTEKHHSADDRTLSEAELDQVSGGMTLEENLSDLRRHAEDFTRAAGYTFTVLDPDGNDVIGCVYLYPSSSATWDVTVKSWVRADMASLDLPLGTAVPQLIWCKRKQGPIRRSASAQKRQDEANEPSR